MKAVLVDDERLAISRLKRLLERQSGIEVADSFTNPLRALAALTADPPDVLFLDIEMPGMSGFELLEKLEEQPLVVFTTAYDKYALKAFEVNSVDYLVKPVEEHRLHRALTKIARIRGGGEPAPDLKKIVAELASTLQFQAPEYPVRISSRTGDRVVFIDLEDVSHFFARDKLTYAATPKKTFIVDYTIADLEEKLDPARFVRIHRSTILSLNAVHELHTWFGGRMVVRLKDEKRTELTVARDRVKTLKQRLAL